MKIFSNEKFDIIYSLGIDCGAALYLRQNNLRLCAGPFDWVTGPGLLQRAFIISNNFDNFLRLNDLSIIPINKNGVYDNQNDNYFNKFTNFSFYHDFKTGVSLEQSFPQVKKKYTRRIKRLYKLGEKAKKMLFVYFSQETKTNRNEILKSYNLLKNKFSSNVFLLVIEHDELGDDEKFIIRSKNIVAIRMNIKVYSDALALNGGYTTQGNTKKVNKIFKKLNINKSFYFVLKYFLYKFKIILLK